MAKVFGEGAQIRLLAPEHPGAGRECPLGFVLVVDFRQHVEPEVEGVVVEGGRQAIIGERCDIKRGWRPAPAARRLGDLKLGRWTKSFAQDGKAPRVPRADCISRMDPPKPPCIVER